MINNIYNNNDQKFTNESHEKCIIKYEGSDLMIEFQNVYKSFKDKHVLENWPKWLWKNNRIKND